MSELPDFPVQKVKQLERNLRKRPLDTNKSSSDSKRSSVPQFNQTRDESVPLPTKKACLRLIGEISQVCHGATVYRLILEVLKICSPRDVLLSTSIVDKRWIEASSSRELWFSFQESMYVPNDFSSTDPKSTYAAYTHQQNALVSLSSRHISVLNKQTAREKTTPLTSPLLPQFYSFAMLLDGSLLCCGGHIPGEEDSTATASAYLIGADGKVSVQRDMIRARKNHGVVGFGRKLFVFGGTKERWMPVLENEMLEEGSWSRIPDLYAARICFVPCVYQGRIYLSGGSKSSVEVFNPESMKMSLLDGVTIPGSFPIVATVHDNCLVVITNSKLYRWSFREKRMKVTEKPTYFIMNTTRTVLHGDLLYLIHNYGPEVSVIEVTTGRLLSSLLT